MRDSGDAAMDDRQIRAKYHRRDLSPIEFFLDSILGDADAKVKDYFWLKKAKREDVDQYCRLIIAKSLAKLAHAFEQETDRFADRDGRQPVTFQGSLEEIVISLRDITEGLSELRSSREEE